MYLYHNVLDLMILFYLLGQRVHIHKSLFEEEILNLNLRCISPVYKGSKHLSNYYKGLCSKWLTIDWNCLLQRFVRRRNSEVSQTWIYVRPGCWHIKYCTCREAGSILYIICREGLDIIRLVCCKIMESSWRSVILFYVWVGLQSDPLALCLINILATINVAEVDNGIFTFNKILDQSVATLQYRNSTINKWLNKKKDVTRSVADGKKCSSIH